jgi:hypothetical protein
VPISVTSRFRAPVSIALLLGGALLIGSCLFLGWYVITGSSGAAQGATENFYSFGSTTASASLGNFSGSYAQANLPATGSLLLVVVGVALAGAILGALVGALIALRWAARHRRLVLGLSLAASALAVTAPVLLALALPGSVCSDARGFSAPFGPPGGSVQTGGASCTWEFYLGGGAWYGTGSPMGPGNSFVGHSGANPLSLSWGPGSGWYVSTLGAALIVAGTAWWGLPTPTGRHGADPHLPGARMSGPPSPPTPARVA